MPERSKPRTKADKDYQEVCFALSKTFFSFSEKAVPLFDFKDSRSRFKRVALKARCNGLINQNPGPELLEPTSQSV